MMTRLIRALALVLMVSAPVGAALFRVWVHHDAVQFGYAISEADSERRALRRHVQQLEVELAAEHSPDALNRVATRLGFRAPTPTQVIDARSDSGSEL